MSIYEDLAEVAKEVGAVRKTDRNQFQNFNFRGIDAVVNAVAGPLHKRGILGPIPNVLNVDRVTNGKMTAVTVTVEYFFRKGDEKVAGVTVGEAFDAGDKATAKAMSVAMRTFLLQALCLPTDEPDPDSHTYSEPVEKVDVVDQARRECAELVQRFTKKFGGDPKALAAEWQNAGGTADPAALQAWLTARIGT